MTKFIVHNVIPPIAAAIVVLLIVSPFISAKNNVAASNVDCKALYENFK